MAKRILLLEDAADVQLLVTATLKDFEVCCAPTVAKAMDLATSEHFDAFLLDVELPDGSGFDFLKSIRPRLDATGAPALFLTSRNDPDGRIAGFSLGADDYIAKPFDPRELKVRLQNQLRRAEQTRSTTANLVVGDLALDLATLRVQWRATGTPAPLPVALTPIEFKLLAFMGRSPGKTLSRDALITEVWGTAVHISPRVVDTHLSSLRKKITSSAVRIASVHGEGYRLQTTDEARRAA